MHAMLPSRMHALGGGPRRSQSTSSIQEGAGSVIFTHLFSAPLVERKMAEGGSGCAYAEKVDELSYEGERETLRKTLNNAGKSVQFLSEAANTQSFACAVGCCPSAGGGRGDRVGNSAGNSNRYNNSNCSCCADRPGLFGRGTGGGSGWASFRRGGCRIMHFTGHGVRGQLTFEDRHGQLQYVDAENLLAMLQCKNRRDVYRSRGSNPNTGNAAAVAAARTRRKEAAMARAPVAAFGGAYGMGNGYGHFQDLSAPLSEDLELEEWEGEDEWEEEEEAMAPPRTGLRLVFLSSCHSQSVAECFIEAGVRHVIAVRQDAKVLDHKAADFAESFYTSLLRGDTVRQAFLLSSDRLIVSDQPEEGHKFLLLPKDGNHDVPVFQAVPTGPFVDLTPLKPPHRCDAVSNFFWGRAVDVQKVVEHMVNDDRCVTITGQRGIGKTQVLLKACEYTQERHVFGEIFFCRVDKAGRGDDACNWLEKGFQLPAGSLGAHNIDGAVAKIAAHVKGQLEVLRKRGVGASNRALLVLDGCEQHVVVGQERVELKNLLYRLFKALPKLTAAVTMRATGLASPGMVGIAGEKVVVVGPLDDRSTAELLTMCCPRRIQKVELDPNNIAVRGRNGKLDTLGAFAKGDIVRALRGHPACVQDLCRSLHEERSLFLRKKEFLEDDIPKLQAKYAYPDEARLDRPMADPIRRAMDQETVSEAFDRFWDDVSGRGTMIRGFYGPSGSSSGREGGEGSSFTWERVCWSIARCFRQRVPGAATRPLQSVDYDLFAEDSGLWAGPCPAQMAQNQGVHVSAVMISREQIAPFWSWFWHATTTLRRTAAWMAGEGCPARGFAGFMKKDSAFALLASANPGTFLIRFSTSIPGALAVHYTSTRGQGSVISVVVNVNAGGELSCSRHHGSTETYRTLDELALSRKQLVYLHPDIPKAEVFHRPQHRNSWAPGQPRMDGILVRRQSAR